VTATTSTICFLQAQSYQESRLQQDAQPCPAVGLMQPMPVTGASMKVGDIRRPNPAVLDNLPRKSARDRPDYQPHDDAMFHPPSPVCLPSRILIP